MKWKHYLYLVWIALGLWWVGSMASRIIEGSNIGTAVDCLVYWRCFIT